MSMLIIDFETKSRCNLKTVGAYNYAQDESTDVLCCSFIPQDSNDDREFLWYPSEGQLQDKIVKLIKSASLIAAHNAGFDRLIWDFIAVNDYGFPEVDLDDWYCTSAQMRVNNLPASLEDAARALNTKHKKDHRGAQLIRLLSIPQKDGEFHTTPELLAEMGAYCLQDSRTTKGIVNATRLMTQTEHSDWLNNEDINDRGVKIDRPMALAAQTYSNDEFLEIATELALATNGVITRHTQSARAAQWVVERLHSEEARNMMFKYVAGEPKLTLDKQARAALIDADTLGTIELPEDVFTVITLIDEGNQSSVSKFKNMVLRADVETDKVQGAFVYAGASQTQRYASRGLQMHNMPSRNLYKSIDEAWTTYDRMIKGAKIDKPVMQTLKKMLRHAVMPNDGELLVIGDWTGIEARVLPWLSDSDGGNLKLDKIESGVDVYTEAAHAIGTENRAVGKVMELACGYEGGANAFKVFAKSYGVVMPEEDIKPAIDKWRLANSWVVTFWRALESAAIKAVQNPRKTFSAGLIDYMFEPDLIEGTLLCFLPDGSTLQYPKARLERDSFGISVTALKASVKMKADADEWPRESLYGGRLAGHCAQGTAAALLRNLISRVDKVIAHVHDELILSVPEDEADDYLLMLDDAMGFVPDWAEGLPLDAKCEIAERYKK